MRERERQGQEERERYIGGRARERVSREWRYERRGSNLLFESEKNEVCFKR